MSVPVITKLSQTQHIKYMYQYQWHCFRPNNYNVFSSTQPQHCGRQSSHHDRANIHDTFSGPKLKKSTQGFSHHVQYNSDGRFIRPTPHPKFQWQYIPLQTRNLKQNLVPAALFQFPVIPPQKKNHPFFRVSEQLMNIPVWFWRLLCTNFSLSVQSDCACIWGKLLPATRNI